MRILDLSPTPLPHGYKHWINTPDNEDDLAVLRVSVNKGVPYGWLGRDLMARGGDLAYILYTQQSCSY